MFPEISTAVRERLHARITGEPNSGCWLWLGPMLPNGYGKAQVKQKSYWVHRLFYQMYKGEVHAGRELDHLCRVRLCVNPAHLEPVTRRENVRRGISQFAAKMNSTHCVNGHEFSNENTMRKPDGRRECRTCRLARRRHRYSLGIRNC